MQVRQACNPGEVGPCPPQNISMQISMLVACLCLWQDAAARRSSGRIPRPTAAPHQHTDQAHKISDEVILMTPEIFLDLTETLPPITSPDALLASQSTRLGRAVTLLPAEILPFTDVVCSNSEGWLQALGSWAPMTCCNALHFSASFKQTSFPVNIVFKKPGRGE